MKTEERLKNLKFDPLLKISLTLNIAKSWQRNNNIKLFLAREILKILKDVYQPIGLWKQNPKSSKEDFGVIIDNEWSPLMQADTNWSFHHIIFNRCNKFLVNLYRLKNIEELEIEGEIFSYKNQIIFNENDTENETIDKIKKMLKIIRYKKNEIFLKDTPIYDELIILFNKIMGIGDVAQKFYEKDIYHFFPDIVSYKSTKGRGDYDDRKEGVDIWKTQLSEKTTDQVKNVCNIIKSAEGFFIDVTISSKSKCDYFVFVCVNSRILVLKNDMSKIVFKENGVFFPESLFYNEKYYD